MKEVLKLQLSKKTKNTRVLVWTINPKIGKLVNW